MATSWPYEFNARGAAHVLPRGEFYIEVALLRSQLQDTVKSDLCAEVAPSEHYPPMDVRGLSIAEADKVQLGPAALPQYRFEGSTDRDYYIDIRVTVERFPASGATQSEAENALRGLVLPDWPDHC